MKHLAFRRSQSNPEKNVYVLFFQKAVEMAKCAKPIRKCTVIARFHSKDGSRAVQGWIPVAPHRSCRLRSRFVRLICVVERCSVWGILWKRIILDLDLQAASRYCHMPNRDGFLHSWLSTKCCLCAWSPRLRIYTLAARPWAALRFRYIIILKRWSFFEDFIFSTLHRRVFQWKKYLFKTERKRFRRLVCNVKRLLAFFSNFDMKCFDDFEFLSLCYVWKITDDI